MDIVSLLLGVTNCATALVLMAVAFPLARGTVKRNNTYGFRFPQALESDEAWLAINRYGARRLLFWSVPLLLLGLVTFSVPLAHNMPAVLATANAPLIVLIPVVESWRFARQYQARQ